jgi:hypothetical protein
VASANSIVITGIDPPGFDQAAPAEQRAFRVRTGELAVHLLRDQLRRGIGRDGQQLKPVKPSSRPDGARGKPLVPHNAASRTSKWLRYSIRKDGVTLWWSHGWATILGYHRRGEGHLPVRDVGPSDATLRRLKSGMAEWWRRRHRVPILAGPGVAQHGPEVLPLVKPPAPPRRGPGRAARAPKPALPRIAPGTPAELVAKYPHLAQFMPQTAGRPSRPGPGRTPPAPKPPPPRPPAGFVQEMSAALAGVRGLKDRDRVVHDMIAARATPSGPAQMHGMATAEDFHAVEFGGVRFHFAPLGPFNAAAEKPAPVVDTIRTLHQYETEVRPLPRRLIAQTRAVYFTAQANEADAARAAAYGPGFVSGATGGDGAVVVYHDAPLAVRTLAHESGHNLATALYGRTTPAEGSAYRQAIDSDEPPPSDYARVNHSEDFAEAARLYATMPDELQRIAPRRYEVIRKMLEAPSYGG